MTPGIFAQPIIYVLECKWGLVSKRDVDDFLEVLRKVNLPTYTARMNIQLLKAGDFNKKLREKGCTKAIVQKICKYAKDENEVREILEAIWKSPEKDAEILAEAALKNKEVYEFEKMLEEKGKHRTHAQNSRFKSSHPSQGRFTYSSSTLL